MKKATSAYRMSKAGKIYLINTWNRGDRRARRCMIVESEIAAAEANTRRVKTTDNSAANAVD